MTQVLRGSGGLLFLECAPSHLTQVSGLGLGVRVSLLAT